MLLTDLVSAFVLLTRLPITWFVPLDRTPNFARCVWAFPVVGFIVNGAGSFVYWLAYKVGMPPFLAAAWALVAIMIITGAFHEDGLADTADGFGGGSTREQKMEIMRDSCIGSYGVLALLLSVSVRAAAIAALGQPHIVMTAMILAGMLGRSGMLLLLVTLSPARNDGMAAVIGKLQISNVMVGVGFSVIASFLLLSILSAATVIMFALASSLCLAALAAEQIGGHTGDVLGASEVATECVVLTIIVSVFVA